jgi:formylmethanofuran dehydrogenase subunit D
MARRKYNHRERITDFQLAKIKAISPGTLIQFRYTGENIFDNKPMVLVLWNDKYESKIHGINLNYLNEFKVKTLFNEIMERGNILTEEDQDDSIYDDKKPYRNLLKDPYTRVKLPTYKENRGGNPLSKAEAVKQMNMLYEKKLKNIIKKEDIYRSYHQKKMSSIMVITYDTKGLLK